MPITATAITASIMAISVVMSGAAAVGSSGSIGVDGVVASPSTLYVRSNTNDYQRGPTSFTTYSLFLSCI